jgi:hypothetical protein
MEPTSRLTGSSEQVRSLPDIEGVAGESTRSGPANSSLTRPHYCLAMKRVLALVVVALVVVATSSAQTRRKDPLRLTYVIEGRGICLAGPTRSKDIRLTKPRPTSIPLGHRTAGGLRS